jgi:hypothetical protein
MRIFLKLAAVAAMLVGGGIGTASVAYARGGDDTVDCGSNNRSFGHCKVPWRDAQLVQQESRAACDRGSSWGVDGRGIWVDKGCRGVFAEVRRRGPGYGGNSYGDGGRPYGGEGSDGRRRQQVVNCGSRDGQRGFCAMALGHHAVQLVSQDSQARCTQGYSWDWTRNGIWVDHGCRGRFSVDIR